VIGRLWHGWTKPEDADAYERLLRDAVLPALREIDGYEGGFVMRRGDGNLVEFAVLNLFDSLDAVRAFAGDDYEVPVFEPAARRLLARIEPIARHYEMRAQVEPAPQPSVPRPDRLSSRSTPRVETEG
jgi:hypothetical protein